VLGHSSGRLAGPPQCGAPGPLDVALSLLVHRCFPLAAGSVRIALDWLGLPPATATGSTGQVATRQSVSRQRVLFVLSRLRGAAGMIPPPPALAGCLTFIKQGPAARHAGDTAAALYSAGLVACPVHPETVRRAAELFEVTPGFALRRSRAGAFVVTDRHVRGFDELPGLLRTATGKRGVVRIAEVAGGLPADALQVAVDGVDGMVVHGGWCWRVPDTSQVAHVLARTLTVCGPLPPDELLTGLQWGTRHSPAATGQVPAAVLLAYLHSQSGLRLAEGRIGLTRPAPEVLTACDRALAGAFAGRRLAGLPTGELLGVLSAAGLSATGASALLSFSPLLRQVRLGVHALRGGPR